MIESKSRLLSLESGFVLGPWRVEPGRNTIFHGSDEKHLENRLMQTLVFLAEHQGKVVSREQFFDSVWQGLVVNEEALSRAISLLRSALNDDAHTPKYIQTVPGIGYCLIADVTAVHHREPGISTRNDKSIAVLPFINFSDDSDNEYFSDGVSEEILNALAQVKRFKVVGRTSSFVFKGRNEDLREIGRILEVAHVLEGSVRKAGNRVRITAQLIKTGDGYHLWSKTFDRELNDIFLVQDEIATAVTKALKIELLGDKSDHQAIGGTLNTKAYQAYLLGIHYHNRGALKETVQHAAEAFEKAIELDPGYARAYSSLARTWVDKLWNGYTSHEEGVAKVDALVSRAIALAPDLADGYLSLGLLQDINFFQEGRNALKAIGRALELNPGSALIQIQFARINSHYGNAEISIESAKKAVELDPVSVYANHLLGHVLYFTRHYEEAIRAFRHTLELAPHYPKPHYFIAMSHYWLGDTKTAYDVIQHEPLDWMRWTASSVILHRLGRTAESEENFALLAEVGISENNFIQQAGIHAQLGDLDQAFESLNVALNYGDPGFSQLLVDPFSDPIRDDPRFARIVSKIGLNLLS